jgi:hypothetical protein
MTAPGHLDYEGAAPVVGFSGRLQPQNREQGLTFMRKQWTILFCDPQVKSCPISDFLDLCRPEHQVKILHILELLEEMGPNLPRPYADTLHDGIHEIRVKLSGEQVRLLYFFCFERFIIFFEVLRKHTSRVPEEYIRKTSHYRDEIIKRLNKSLLEGVAHVDP